jgi:aminobenzoyl-glutamate utilization protein B
VSWKVPMGRLWFPGNVPHLPFHHWSAGAALATSIAHKGGLAGAKALAASVIDYFQNNDLVPRTKDSFKNELGGVAYKPLLPDDQRAPAHLNQALMEKFRPAMEPHYVKAEPVFTL